MNIAASRLAILKSQRSDLKAQDRFREAVPIQDEIIALLEASGATADELASAHNMQSVHCFGAGLTIRAEKHAQRALDLHTGESIKAHETLGAYHIVMARILASRDYFEPAARHGEKAIAAYSHFHQPPDEFLATITTEVRAMKDSTWRFGA